jgi:uncharacterized protein YndB with AHSA1/START domain
MTMMSAPVVQAQVRIDASTDAVYQALTDENALRSWFAEEASVAIDEGRYAFSGRYTLGTPKAGDPGMKLLDVEPGHKLVFSWPLSGADSVVAVGLSADGSGSEVRLEHHDIGETTPWLVESFWSMALENLIGYVERGEPGLRFDFSNIPHGTIELKTEINADPDDVFDALIDPVQLDRYMSGVPARIDPQIGGVYNVGWGDEGPMKILDLEPGARLTYSWESNKPEIDETIVTWELEGSAGRTRLTIVHSGFAPDRACLDYGLGWTDFLNRIKQMVEVGDAWTRPTIRSVDPRDIRDEGLFYPGLGVHDAISSTRYPSSARRGR